MITALVGLNGSGKSTELRRLAADATAVRTGIVPEAPDVPVELSAVDLLARVGAIRGLAPDEAGRRARFLVDALSIDGGVDSPVAVYSTGSYRKTSLALAVIDSPDLLLLDEPLETVDPQSIRSAMAILAQMSEAGTGIVFSTHDLDLVMAHADRVRVMVDLAVAAEGSPAEVLGSDPFHRLCELAGVESRNPVVPWLV